MDYKKLLSYNVAAPQLNIVYYQIKLLVPVVGLNFSSYWLKGSHRPPLISQAIFNVVGCPPQVDNKALLLKSTTYLCHRTLPLNIYKYRQK